MPEATNIISIEGLAKICHEANRAYCQAIGDDSQHSWEDAPEWQRRCSVEQAQWHLSKKDSMPSDSHDNWLKEKQANGWIWGKEKDAELKTHPCMVPYNDLPLKQQLKDSIFLNIVRAFTDHV